VLFHSLVISNFRTRFDIRNSASRLLLAGRASVTNIRPVMKLPKTSIAMALALFVPFSPASSSAAKKAEAKTPFISATDSKKLKANIGNKVSVEGKVISTGKGPKDGMRFMNFSKSEKTGFTAALLPAVYAKFPNLDRMVNEKVRVTGELETYKKKSIIKVTRPTQVKVLKPAKAKTTKKKKKEAAE
jgi:hypothetical protein